MDLDATNTFFGVSDKARLKHVSLATETSKKIDILSVASLDMILTKRRIIKGMHIFVLRLCSLQTSKDSFLASRPKYFVDIYVFVIKIYNVFKGWMENTYGEL